MKDCEGMKPADAAIYIYIMQRGKATIEDLHSYFEMSAYERRLIIRRLLAANKICLQKGNKRLGVSDVYLPAFQCVQS